MNEQNNPVTGPRAEPEFAAWVAIDWADQKHFWKFRVAHSQQVESGELDNTPEAVEEWMRQLRFRFGDRPLAIAVEQRRGALVAMLSKYGQLHLYPVHPLTLARYREAFSPSGSKDDPHDAALLLELLSDRRDKLRRLEPDTAELRLLQFQVENRRKLVDQKTAYSNRLTDQLKLYFPQILSWFESVDSALVGDLLERWPTLEQLQGARRATLQTFFRQHNCRDESKVQQRLEQIRQAIPATHDEAVLKSACLMTRIYVRQIAGLRESIAELDRNIAALAQQQPDWEIFESLPGAGPALAPRLMAALGSRRERFQSASQLQCYSGIAPVKEASGKTQRVHQRWACPKFQRQTFHEWAACSIRFSHWARDCYERQRAKNKSHHTAVRTLAFKWQRILYRCWKDHQPYREDLYMARLAQRAMPLAQLAKSVQIPGANRLRL